MGWRSSNSFVIINDDVFWKHHALSLLPNVGAGAAATAAAQLPKHGTPCSYETSACIVWAADDVASARLRCVHPLQIDVPPL